MSLAPGTWLNHYQILGHLGTGGMGEVYRALDNKLQREVALKVLPKAFAQDPERLARFRREAQVLAQLNHVNVAAIHSVEQSGETHFLVMELALGDTLRDRIKRSQSLRGSAAVSAAPGSQRDAGATSRPVPLEEALDICKQIAAGLEHAHEKPIVHRDLKPANIKVTPEGVVKILDFGLARAFAGDSGSGDPADSPTLSAMTAPGTILGTAAYMSPEQARGKKVDKRTDIWALGCLLYELLTGQQAFQSRDRERAANQSPDREGGGTSDPHDTIADIIGAVLYKEPDWTALPATTPHWVRVLLRRCLEKDAKRRFSSAADLQIQIDEALTAPATAAPPPAVPVPSHPTWRRVLPWGVAASLGILLAISTLLNLRQPTPRPIERLVVPLAVEEPLPSSFWPVLALSPDGAQLAYKTNRGIYVRAMDSFAARLLPGTQAANDLFFSPDGQWIGFFAGGLKKVSVSGGAVLTLTNTSGFPRGASWGPNDTIVFATVNTGGLWQVSAAGGEPQALTKLKEGEGSHYWPQFLPDGKSVLFTVNTGGNPDDWHIAAQRLDTAEYQILIRGGTYARYVPSGHLVYYRAGTIMAVPFDPVRLEVTGTPAPVIEGVMAGIGNIGAAQFSFSSLGSLAYVPGGAEVGVERKLVWVDRRGVEEPLGAPLRAYETPRLSPDGRRIAFTIRDANADIWVYEIGRQTLTRLTFDAAEDERPVWTPDGKWLTFAGERASGRTLFRKLADGGGQEEQLAAVKEHAHPSSWSPDGRVLAFETAAGSNDVWLLPSEGDPRQAGAEGRKPTQFLGTPFVEGAPQFSPDGRWIAYVSNESGRSEVYVQPYPGPGGKWQVSTEGGTEPIWARNGRELFYRNGDRIMVGEVTTQPIFSPGSPKLLFEGQYQYVLTGSLANYDISPDGQRFLMIQDVTPAQALTQINVVLNWFEELKRRVPSGQ